MAGQATKLNAATGSGKCRGKAPHKPLLLLCLLDMAEAGELGGRTFMRTAGLVLRFNTYGALVSKRWPTRLDMRMPFSTCGRKVLAERTRSRGNEKRRAILIEPIFVVSLPA